MNGSPDNAAKPSVGSVIYVRLRAHEPALGKSMHSETEKKRFAEDLQADEQSSIRVQDRP